MGSNLAHRGETPVPGGRADGAGVRVLVVDDERSMRELLGIVLRRQGYEVMVAESGRQALAVLEREPIDLLLSDIKLPDVTGVEVLREAKRLHPGVAGIMMTAFASTDTAVEALRIGAYDYLTKPFDVDELKIVVRNAVERCRLRQENVLLKRAFHSAHQFGHIIGRSPAIRQVFELIETIAPTGSTVLITGESGTGKELVARAIHVHSPRADRPFVALNCGALPESLLESELFGHVKGAFTGASAAKKGLVEVANRGTIFLDEIGEMSASMQVKLLRVLQERTYRRVGGTDEIEADIRIIAATNRDLGALVVENTFREDLYYRINVIPLHLPPLRERREDIALLAQHFCEKFSAQMGKAVHGISREAQAVLEAHSWPGNVRELENVVERAIALERGAVVVPDSLPPQLRPARPPSRPEAGGEEDDPFRGGGFDLERHVEDIEREYIAVALRRAGGVKVRAAELLGMSFRSFRYYVKKYNLG